MDESRRNNYNLLISCLLARRVIPFLALLKTLEGLKRTTRPDGGTTSIPDPSGNVTTYTYDALGHMASMTDGNGNTTYYEYNSQGQLVKVTDAIGNMTSYSYGSSGCSSCGGGGANLSSITDANGHATAYQYDTLGRLVSETDPQGNAIAYAYDSVGRMTSKTDALGHTTTYTYDSVGRLTGKAYPDGSAVEFEYDSKGNITYAANEHVAYSFAYDSPGRVTEAVDSNGLVVSYTYDAAGRRTSLTYPGGSAVNYTYDSGGRLASLVSEAGTFAFAYDSMGRRTGLIYPNGAYASFAYDDSGRLMSLAHKKSDGSAVASFSYTLDNVGNRLTKAMAGDTLTYKYDALYRLTEALSSTPGNSTNTTGKGKGTITAIENQKEWYAYDPVGNRLTAHDGSYAYNEGNELASGPKASYQYDRNGNLVMKATAEGTTSYAYDYENRLSKVVMPDGMVVEFAYDPFGRRIEKSVNGSATGYFYDNEDILFEYDSTGNVGNVYVHGLGIDEPLALIQEKNTYFYHADGLGSITALTDTSQKVVQTYEYNSFGNLKDMKNAVKQPYTFTGREYDRETGLYYYRARYYDAEAGRFTSFDPILHPVNGRIKTTCGKGSSNSFLASLIETPQVLNPYIYAGDNPINLTDPRGLLPYTDSLTQWHLWCLKMPTSEERCKCHCQYATDFDGCKESCMKCFSSKTPLSTYELCKCACEAAELENCDCICKTATK